MKAADFLTLLRSRDIQVWVDGDHLRCSAPAGALTPELRDGLRERKAEILQFLRSAGSLARQQRAIVPLQPRGTLPPIFAFGGHNGDVFCFRALAQHLGEEQPFYGLQPPGLDGHQEPLTRIEDLAAYFAHEIRAFQPLGPYAIAGYCAGGTLAFELARQLLQQGVSLHGLALFGSPFPTWYRLLPQLRERLRRAAVGVSRHTCALASMPPTAWPAYIGDRWHNLRPEAAPAPQAEPDPVLVWRAKVGRATLAAIRRYVPSPFPARLRLFWPSVKWRSAAWALERWAGLAQGAETYFGPDGSEGPTMLREPHAAAFADLYRHSSSAGVNRSVVIQSALRPAHPPVGSQQMNPLPL